MEIHAQAGYINAKPAFLSPDDPPILLVVVDIEGGLDWNHPTTATQAGGGAALRAVETGQALFDRFGVRPLYAVDFAAACSGPEGAALRTIITQDRGELAALLNPRVNPPLEEASTPRSAFPGLLPPELERGKLLLLLERITEAFGQRPFSYKAGRHGFGPNTAAILDESGFLIDLSAAPGFDFSADFGPNHRGLDNNPFWFGRQGRQLALPATSGYTGLLHPLGATLHPLLRTRLGTTLHLPEICSRLNLLDQVRLAPTGFAYPALRRLTNTRFAQGARLFTLHYCATSLLPIGSPMGQRADNIERLKTTGAEYFQFFFEELGGITMTPSELRLKLLTESGLNPPISTHSHMPFLQKGAASTGKGDESPSR